MVQPHIFIHYGLFEQKAKMLEFPTHSSFVLDMRMAKNPEAVTTFLTDLSKKLQPLKEAEMKLFLEYKKEEVQSLIYSNNDDFSVLNES